MHAADMRAGGAPQAAGAHAGDCREQLGRPVRGWVGSSSLKGGSCVQGPDWRAAALQLRRRLKERACCRPVKAQSKRGCAAGPLRALLQCAVRWAGRRSRVRGGGAMHRGQCSGCRACIRRPGWQPLGRTMACSAPPLGLPLVLERSVCLRTKRGEPGFGSVAWGKRMRGTAGRAVAGAKHTRFELPHQGNGKGNNASTSVEPNIDEPRRGNQ